MVKRFVFASAGLLFGCGIMGVSLVNASEVFPSSTETDTKISRLDITQPILPGHPLYPFTVVSDKYAVLVATEEQKPERHLQLARERLEDSLQLIEMQQTELAAQTLVKGQKYLIHSVEEKDVPNQSVKFQAIETFKEYQTTIETHKDEFSDPQKVLLDQIYAENETILLYLQ